MGSPLYPEAAELLVTVDGGGSNSIRSRLWKIGLQELADDLGLAISLSNSVYHSPLTSLTTVVKVAALQIAQGALE